MAFKHGGFKDGSEEFMDRFVYGGICLALAMLPRLCSAAGGAYVVDDATIVNPKTCQLDTVMLFRKASREWWLLPACNPSGNLEVTAGPVFTRDDGEGAKTDWLAQVKRLGKKLKRNGYGYGMVVGTTWHQHPDADESRLSTLYVYVPVSFSFRDDQTLLHLNAGYLYNNDRARGAPYLGIAGEWRLADKLGAEAEFFGYPYSERRPLYQAGLAYQVIKDHLSLVATYGQELTKGGQGQWYSLGVNLVSPPLW